MKTIIIIKRAAVKLERKLRKEGKSQVFITNCLSINFPSL